MLSINHSFRAENHAHSLGNVKEIINIDFLAVETITSLTLWETLQVQTGGRMKFTLVEYPLDKPNLALLNFWLFLKLKKSNAKLDQK